MCAAPNNSTWNLSPPRRPGLPDFENASLQDDVANPPVPGTHPTSALVNTLGFSHISVGKVVPNGTVSINGGTTPTIAYQTYCGSSVPSPTINRTGAGVVQLTWPANTFPGPIANPKSYLNAGPGMIHATAITNGVQVNTYNSAGTATDLSFTVDIF